jgi:hypothetical protein
MNRAVAAIVHYLIIWSWERHECLQISAKWSNRSRLHWFNRMLSLKAAQSFRGSCELLLESFHDRRSSELSRLSLASLKSLAPHRLRPCRIA